MIKVYDTNHQFLALLDQFCKNIHTIDSLDLGIRELCFYAPCKEEYINILQEENYVETADYNFVIKELNLQSNDFMSVRCGPDIEALKGRVFPAFDCFELSLQQAYEYCVQNTGWTVEYNSPDKSVATYQEPWKTAYEMIKTIAEDYGQELWFDTKNKVLRVYDKMGVSAGAYFSNELRLKQLSKQSSAYDYATVLYPVGKDGLLISNVNNGKPYLENFTYSNKYIEKVFIDDKIEIPEILKQKAEEYLEEISIPRASYKVKLTDLGKSVSIGDTIMIVDNIKRIKQKQRVVKITRYPFAPEKDTIEISNLQPDFINSYVKGDKKTKKEIEYLKKLYNSLK